MPNMSKFRQKDRIFIKQRVPGDADPPFNTARTACHGLLGWFLGKKACTLKQRENWIAIINKAGTTCGFPNYTTTVDGLQIAALGLDVPEFAPLFRAWLAAATAARDAGYGKVLPAVGDLLFSATSDQESVTSVVLDKDWEKVLALVDQLLPAPAAGAGAGAGDADGDVDMEADSPQQAMRELLEASHLIGGAVQTARTVDSKSADGATQWSPLVRRFAMRYCGT